MALSHKYDDTTSWASARTDDCQTPEKAISSARGPRHVETGPLRTPASRLAQLQLLRQPSEEQAVVLSVVVPTKQTFLVGESRSI